MEKDKLLDFINEDDMSFFLEIMDNLNDEELDRFLKDNPDILKEIEKE